MADDWAGRDWKTMKVVQFQLVPEGAHKERLFVLFDNGQLWTREYDSNWMRVWPPRSDPTTT